VGLDILGLGRLGAALLEDDCVIEQQVRDLGRIASSHGGMKRINDDDRSAL